MNKQKKVYLKPEVAEVKFEDKNLVAFDVCSKVGKGQSVGNSDCCDLVEGGHNRDIQDPS